MAVSKVNREEKMQICNEEGHLLEERERESE